jgi:very-short-patch-repair endonuclease
VARDCYTVQTLPDPQVKSLRDNETVAEKRLRQQLRKKRIDNRRFRRQYRLGRYIVDFVCLSARLVVEVDGPSHEVTVREDEVRTRWLVSQGFRVTRFSSEDVLFDIDSVVRTIEAQIVQGEADKSYAG